MGLKTREEYLKSLRQMKPTAYMFGEQIIFINVWKSMLG